MPERRSDFLGEQGAEELARKIRRYWQAEGYEKVMVAVAPLNSVAHSAIWVIRSNIGENGPPR